MICVDMLLMLLYMLHIGRGKSRTESIINTRHIVIKVKQYFYKFTFAFLDLSHPWITKEQYESWNFFQKHFRKLPISGLFLWQIYTEVNYNPKNVYNSRI